MGNESIKVDTKVYDALHKIKYRTKINIKEIIRLMVENKSIQAYFAERRKR